MTLPIVTFGLLATVTEAIMSATLMLTITGALTAIVLSRVSVRSWRLQSILVAAVLLQGVMLIRTPVHLGLIEALPQPMTEQSTSREDDINSLAALPPGQPQGRQAASLIAGATTAANHSAGWSAFPAFALANLFWGIWMLGVVVLIALALLGYFRMIRLTRQLTPAPAAWQRQWESVAGKRTCQMLVCHSVGPLMMRRPAGYVFIVPESYWRELSDAQRRGVMQHELAHLERHDVWRQLIARAIATIHWFNPVAWWAMRRYEQAAELACDGRVTQAGERVAAGFASALVQLVQWHRDSGTAMDVQRGFGLQAMAAPPLTSRISRLLTPNSKGDSKMKRTILALFTLAVVAMAFVQVRLTAEDNESDDAVQGGSQLAILSESTARRLSDIVGKMDQADAATAQFASLSKTESGRLAIGAYLNALRNRELENARADSVPRFLQQYFSKTDNGKYVIKPDQHEVLTRWQEKSQRIAKAFAETGAAMTDIASRLDTSTEAAALMKRLLSDAQAPAALLLFEMKGGSDVIARYISESLGKALVDRGDGTFQIVESQRAELEKQIVKFEMATRIRKKLAREFPLWAEEFVTDDAQHQKLIKYLNKPNMASVVSVILVNESKGNPALAVEKLFENLEEASTDTADGLKVTQAEMWEKLAEIFAHVDRVDALLPRIQDRLAEIAETLSQDDPLAARMAVQLRGEPVAIALAAELPYADADAGEQLRALLSEIMIETDDNKMTIRADRAEEVGKKMSQLLRVCRSIRRYLRTIDDVMETMEDQEFVTRMGDAGRYLMISEIRRFSESHRPDPIALMETDLLVTTDTNRLRVRDDRREVVRQIVEQAQRVRDEEANDDF